MGIRSALTLAAVLVIGCQVPGGSAQYPDLERAAVADRGPAVASVEAQAASVSAIIVEQPVEVLPTLASKDNRDLALVWQSLNNCGPAAVVMALSSFGISASQETARLALRGTDERRGMGPAGVDQWVKEQFGLRSLWRNNGTNDLIKKLISNGFTPMVTQWLEDPTKSRISHWRTVRGYDDAAQTFYVNDSMRGRGVPLSYSWFAENWQPFSYRYMVIYKPEDEPKLRTLLGDDWIDSNMRRNFYERARSEAAEQNNAAGWLTYGEAAYQYGMFVEAVSAFEKGISLGSPTGVFTMRSSYPNALRALGRTGEADAAAGRLTNLTPGVVGAAAAPTDNRILALVAQRAHDQWVAERPLERSPLP